MLLLVLLCAAELAAILVLNHGVFSFTLDDPYLHLSLAENIARGHYGINAVDAAAPSSSFVWAYLLAPFARAPLGAYVPLVIGFAGAAGTVALYRGVVSRATSAGDAAAPRAVRAMLVGTLVLATNLVGLVFTGMEHSLQVLLAVGLVVGLAIELAESRLPRWLPLVLVLGPFVRYESLALSLPALAVLAWRGHRGVAAACLGAIALGLGGFSLYLHSLGLGWLPVSVIAKSGVVAHAGSGASLLLNLRHNLRPGMFLVLGTAALGIAVLRAPLAADRALAAWAASAAVLHLVVGRFGWYARYEIYIWAAVLVTLLWVWRVALSQALQRVPVIAVAVALVAFLALACRPYLDAVMSTPLAANNIEEQQYQMHRFTTQFWKAPVAAHDLGWVSYRNDDYVLDLEGLASMETRAARAAGGDWMNALAAKHGVELALVSPAVIPHLPANWIPLGTLHLGRRCITPADSLVRFWALDAATVAPAQAAIAAWRRTLPADVRYVDAPGETPLRGQANRAPPDPGAPARTPSR